jgi:hypothetical protein
VEFSGGRYKHFISESLLTFTAFVDSREYYSLHFTTIHSYRTCRYLWVPNEIGHISSATACLVSRILILHKSTAIFKAIDYRPDNRGLIPSKSRDVPHRHHVQPPIEWTSGTHKWQLWDRNTKHRVHINLVQRPIIYWATRLQFLYFVVWYLSRAVTSLLKSYLQKCKVSA